VGTSILAACLFHLAQTIDGSCPIEPTKPERHPAATRRLTEPPRQPISLRGGELPGRKIDGRR
jgi:hypothetical protein